MDFFSIPEELYPDREIQRQHHGYFRRRWRCQTDFQVFSGRQKVCSGMHEHSSGHLSLLYKRPSEGSLMFFWQLPLGLSLSTFSVVLSTSLGVLSSPLSSKFAKGSTQMMNFKDASRLLVGIPTCLSSANALLWLRWWYSKSLEHKSCRISWQGQPGTDEDCLGALKVEAVGNDTRSIVLTPLVHPNDLALGILKVIERKRSVTLQNLPTCALVQPRICHVGSIKCHLWWNSIKRVFHRQWCLLGVSLSRLSCERKGGSLDIRPSRSRVGFCRDVHWL